MKEVEKKKEATSKLGSLEHLNTSSSDEEEEDEEAEIVGKVGQLVETLRKAMAAHASLLTDYATMKKACRDLAHLRPDDSVDNKSKEALDKTAPVPRLPRPLGSCSAR